MAADAKTWVPPPGRHQVSMGGSMTRFLKQRKGIQAKQNKAMPTSNFYHFKYGFKPESVDNTKPGLVVTSQGNDTTSVRVERASDNSEEIHTFNGKEEPAKEIECVLIYDEETKLFTLEKLDSSLTLSHVGRTRAKTRLPSTPPLPTPSPAASMSKIEDEDDLTAELDRELLTTLQEDDADEDIPLAAATRPQTSSSRKADAFVRPLPPPNDSSSGKPKPKLRGVASTGKAKTAAQPKGAPPQPLPTSTPPTPLSASSRGTGKSKAPVPAPSARSADVEEFDFGLPPQPAPRPRATAPHAAPPITAPSTGLGLALPTACGPSTVLPGAPAQNDEDEEDEWDKVADVDAAPPAAAADVESMFGDGIADAEGEEINLDEFAAEMDQELLGGLEDEDAEGEIEGSDIFGDAEMGEDADGGGVAYEEPRSLKPISLNQFAGGGADDADEDDYSSSEDSDDD